MIKNIVCTSLFLILAISILGCDNNNNNTQEGVARTENDFFNDPDLVANPETDHVVMSLEHATSPPEDNLTGDLGNDVFTFRYDQTTSHTYCWDDPDLGAMHFLELIDSEGSVILTVEANSDCVTEVVEAGDYTVRIHHDGREETIHPIFIIPQMDEELAKSSDELPNGLLARIGNLFFEIIDRVDIGITQTTNAQSQQALINTLLLTNSCVGCNLSGADFSKYQLEQANLMNADLSNANMDNSDCRLANFTGANLTNVNLSSFSNLAGAIFNGADLTGADFSTSNLSNAKLVGATLTNANFSCAIWCTGTCTCGETSVGTGTCIGCPSVDNCS